MMRILSIDASTKSTGVAIFDVEEEKTLYKYKCLTASSSDPIQRIKKIIKEIDNFIEENLPINKIILEEVQPPGKLEDESVRTMQTHKTLMHLQAAIVFLLHEKYPKMEIVYIMPNSWRARCGIQTGPGIKREQLKQQDIEFVKTMFNITVNDDIADAIGIGYGYDKEKENKKEIKEEYFNW